MSVEINQRTERNFFYDSTINQPIYQTTIILNILSFHNDNPVCLRICLRTLFVLAFVLGFVLGPCLCLILFDILKAVTIFALVVLNPEKIERYFPRLQLIKFIFQVFGVNNDSLFFTELIIHFGVVMVLEWNLLFRAIELVLFSRFLLHIIFALEILKIPFVLFSCLRKLKIINPSHSEEFPIVLTVVILWISTYILFFVILTLNVLMRLLTYVFIFST